MSSNKRLSSVEAVLRFLGKAILALPLYVVGVAVLLYGVVVILVILAGVITFIITPKYWADSWNTGILFPAIAGVIILSGIDVGITWGGAVTCKAANKIVRRKPNNNLNDIRSSAADSLLRASSKSDAAVREELLRPAVENETPQEQLLRSSQA